MAKKYKCRFCGNTVEEGNCFERLHGKQYWRYCNEEECLKHEEATRTKDSTYKLLEELLNMKLGTMCYKAVGDLAERYSYDLIYSYLVTNRSNIEWCLNKEFSDFSASRYITVMLENSLDEFKEFYDKEKEQEVVGKVISEDEVDEDVIGSRVIKRKNKRKSFMDIEI